MVSIAVAEDDTEPEFEFEMACINDKNEKVEILHFKIIPFIIRFRVKIDFVRIINVLSCGIILFTIR